eukprot:gnl/MRDRNA2_/MRDRNA2_87767_c0_seq1.p1 gnl/MRDRNA2_/MRDRNA2_87767_c0~~gnl/MRDRNA2_/MRDRNA2_87767_c0_seq1.p1  ORF type:complete len:336 (-),score=79.86 gnl/MRDRNA2_/MRDRNA2_87767_c0_seq1:157-1029(-)
MPSSERQKAIEDLVARMNGQTITFGFRKVEPDSRGDEILKALAKGMTFLPEYSLRVEGHSNLAKSEKKLTAEDKARIQKLSEDRAEACARILKAAGVQNELTCVGQGALKGETKGCVRLMLVQKGSPPQVVQASEVEEPHISQEETELPKKELDNVAQASEIEQPHIWKEETQLPKKELDNVDKASGNDLALTPKLGPEATIEEGTRLADVEGADAPSTSESPAKDGAKQDLAVTSKEVAPVPSSAADEADQWGNTYLPWYITCCSHKSRPKTDECPMQGLNVKQMQLLQ